MEKIWLKRVWIPFWVIRIIVVALLLVSVAIGLGFLTSDPLISEQYRGTNLLSAVKASAAVYMTICGFTILFDVVEIVLFARKKLSPVTATVLNTITTLVWLVMFILLIISAVRVGGSALSMIFLILVLATSLGKLIYASVILFRYRKNRSAARGPYTPAQTEAGFDLQHTAYDPAGARPSAPRDYPPVPAPQKFAAAREYYSGMEVGPYEMQQPSAGKYHS